MVPEPEQEILKFIRFNETKDFRTTVRGITGCFSGRPYGLKGEASGAVPPI